MELVPSLGENTPSWGSRTNHGRGKEPAVLRGWEEVNGIPGLQVFLGLIGRLQLQLLGSKTSAEN